MVGFELKFSNLSLYPQQFFNYHFCLQCGWFKVSINFCCVFLCLILHMNPLLLLEERACCTICHIFLEFPGIVLVYRGYRALTSI